MHFRLFILESFCMFYFLVYLLDNPPIMSNLEYNKLNFNRWYNGVYSAYTLVTFHNIIDLFTMILKTNKFYIIFVVPIFMIWLFFILSFLIGLMNHYYVNTVKKHIKSMDNYDGFKKVFYYFLDKNGIVDYTLLDEFISQYLLDPDSIDFSKYENSKRDKLMHHKNNKNELKAKYCNFIRQHKTLREV